jgi:AraC family ethanolamine operon transcriptional activator
MLGLFAAMTGLAMISNINMMLKYCAILRELFVNSIVVCSSLLQKSRKSSHTIDSSHYQNPAKKQKSQAMQNFRVFHFHSHDFDEISASLSRWHQTYRQLSAGMFIGDIDYLRIDDMEIFELHWSQVIHYQGLTPPGTIGFGLPLNIAGEARYLNHPVNNNELLIQHCGAEGDLIGSRNFKIQVLTISEQRFLDKVYRLTGLDKRQQIRRFSRIPLHTMAAETLRGKFRALIQNANHFESAQIERTAVIDTLAEDLLNSIAATVIASDLEQTSIRSLRQRQLLKKAEDFVWSQPAIAPRIDHLCAGLGTSERSLRDAFKACTGISASAYLKTFRLNQVRSELKSRSPMSTRVQDVAFGWGFSHMGQFAADYKRLFGESPSETLQQYKKIQLAAS